MTSERFVSDPTIQESHYQETYIAEDTMGIVSGEVKAYDEVNSRSAIALFEN